MSTRPKVRSRKDAECGKCGAQIKKGVDRRLTFAVGYRGFERTRCMKPACYPKPSERESSMLATVYAAQEENDVHGCETYDDLIQCRDAVVEAIREVASEYEGNEMYEVNEDLQERVSTLESAEQELESWEPEGDEPTEDEDEWSVDGDDYDTFEEAHDAWILAARESLDTAINDLELP